MTTVTARRSGQGAPTVTSAIKTEGLRKTYKSSRGDVEAVRGIDLDVPQGEFFGLLGPNGAGKSTTIGMLTTLVAPTGGRAWVAGHDVTRETVAVKRRIGVVTQNNTLDMQLTVAENLMFRSRFFGLSTAVAAKRAVALIDAFGLSDRKDAMADQLSGGQARRLMIARALVHQPDVLFLDEPTAGLDPQTRVNLWDILQVLHDQGQTILLTTRYMEEAEALCDRIAVVDHGKILAEGPLEAPRRGQIAERIEVVIGRLPEFRQGRGVVLDIGEETPGELFHPDALAQFVAARVEVLDDDPVFRLECVGDRTMRVGRQVARVDDDLPFFPGRGDEIVAGLRGGAAGARPARQRSQSQCRRASRDAHRGAHDVRRSRLLGAERLRQGRVDRRVERLLVPRMVERFTRTERTLHWVHATGFFAMLATGLALYLPALSELVARRNLVKNVHIFAAVAWAIAIVLVVALGDRRRLAADWREIERLDRDDRRWLRGRPAAPGLPLDGDPAHRRARSRPRGTETRGAPRVELAREACGRRRAGQGVPALGRHGDRRDGAVRDRSNLICWSGNGWQQSGVPQ